MKSLKKKISYINFIRLFKSSKYFIVSPLIKSKNNLTISYLLRYAFKKLNKNLKLTFKADKYLKYVGVNKFKLIVDVFKNIKFSSFNLYFIKVQNLCFFHTSFKIQNFIKFLNPKVFLNLIKKVFLIRLSLLKIIN